MLDLSFLIWPLFVMAAVVKIFFDCGRAFQKFQADVGKARSVKASKAAEQPATATAAAQTETAPQPKEPAISSDPITDQLNADPCTVIPFRGPALTVPESVDAEPDLAPAVEPEPGMDPDPHLVATVEDGDSISELFRDEPDWKSYDEPTIHRRKPDWRALEVNEPIEVFLAQPAEDDFAELQEKWEDYAAMMRNANGELIPLGEKRDRQQRLPFH